MTKLFILFVVLSILNVILNTVKSIVTVKGGKIGAALINGITFFVYTYVIIFTNCELNMHLKAVVTGIINIVGVYIVKLIEEKARKDKLWKVEATIDSRFEWEQLISDLKACGIPCNYIDIDKYILINCYCATQRESAAVKKSLDRYNAKYFVTESKTL